ncbi:hypothetical protein JZO70_14745 [Enterococcus sp. 669A]|uniref:Uncharacterized protein n=1 Tax=Candidatus Enterococcus moelleringii TaxID=2815325 RepID=A0ABS3LCS0_9ENTE|nr:hypothetical protein [Enterococcus sp. 669A]MBO1307432.1 hypothetical protein [Enterococcus sp. 669A]
MAFFKEIGEAVGAVRGGIISGVANVAAELTDSDDLREISKVTFERNKAVGKVIGQTLDGVANTTVGTIGKQRIRRDDGLEDLTEALETTKDGVINTINFTTKQVGEVLDGVKVNDSKKVASSAKKLAKESVVGFLTFKNF